MSLDQKEPPQTSSKQCFTPIQSRTMYVSNAATTNNYLPMALCPSMDLMVLLAGNSINTLLLHRTVSWQRLASKIVKPASQEDTATTAETAVQESSEEDPSIQSVCWSPDGRSLAVGLSNKTLVLYHVETIGDSESLPMSSVQTNNGSDESILAMSWSHVGRPHANWRISPTEHLRNMTYDYQSQYYLDRSSRFLPGVYVGSSEQSSSMLHSTQHHYSITTDTHNDEDVDEVLQQQLLSPKCKTPLSLLSVATSDNTIHLFLHGRYPIGTLKAAAETMISSSSTASPSLLFQPKLCSSSDLQYLLYQQGQSLTCFHLPALSHHRYTLQISSALYSSMTFQLQTLQRHLHETLVCWKSSLKPLDMKLEAFQKVLSNYGVNDDVSKVLLSYIRFGQPQDDGPANSALNQFFTSVQMNDQLVQRLEKSLHAALANVEGTCRKGIVRPARALVYDALQLVGLWTTNHHNATATLQLQRSIQSLYKMTELLLSQLVEARVRLHEFVAWLRSVAALIKHKTHHHNDTHKQRRVPQVVVQHITKYLATCVKEDVNSATSTTSVTERLVGLNVSLLCSSSDLVVAAKKRPASPRVVHHDEQKASPTPLPDLLQQTQQDMAVVFEEPRTYVSKSLSQQEWLIESSSDSTDVPMDIYTRIGCESHETIEGCFHPRVATASNEQEFSLCRNWALIARASSWKGELDSVLVYAVPLGWSENSSMDEEDLLDDDDVDFELGPSQVNTPFYLVSRLALPSDCQIQQVSFYGDDGRSSLSSGSDSGTGKEGRQSLGLLVRRSNQTDELWIVPYNSIEYRAVNVPNSNPTEKVVLRETDTVPIVQVQSLGDSQEDSQEATVFAKTRRLSLHEDTSGSNLLLCGSRGVGAVCSTTQQHITLNLFDLEEDEESEDDEEEEDDVQM